MIEGELSVREGWKAGRERDREKKKEERQREREREREDRKSVV